MLLVGKGKENPHPEGPDPRKGCEPGENAKWGRAGPRSSKMGPQMGSAFLAWGHRELEGGAERNQSGDAVARSHRCVRYNSILQMNIEKVAGNLPVFLRQMTGRDCQISQEFPQRNLQSLYEVAAVGFLLQAQIPGTGNSAVPQIALREYPNSALR